jgi:hypothetical protein
MTQRIKTELLDVTDKLEIDNTREIIKINCKYPIELEFEKIKIKFSNKLIKYLDEVKNNPTYYNHVYEKFFILWKEIAMQNSNISLFSLLKYLTKDEQFNIKRTIFSMVSNENLKDPVYLQFICDFIGL